MEFTVSGKSFALRYNKRPKRKFPRKKIQEISYTRLCDKRFWEDCNRSWVNSGQRKKLSKNNLLLNVQNLIKTSSLSASCKSRFSEGRICKLGYRRLDLKFPEFQMTNWIWKLKFFFRSSQNFFQKLNYSTFLHFKSLTVFCTPNLYNPLTTSYTNFHFSCSNLRSTFLCLKLQLVSR